jgi:hypothetical protein
MPGARAPHIDVCTETHDVRELDTDTREYVDMMAAHAGLRLTPTQKKQLYEAAPHALAMVARIQRMHGRDVEPANVFRFASDIGAA